MIRIGESRSSGVVAGTGEFERGMSHLEIKSGPWLGRF